MKPLVQKQNAGWGLCHWGAEDIPQQKYAYSMPLVHPLVGLSVGDETTVRVPSGEIHMTIQTIEPMFNPRNGDSK